MRKRKVELAHSARIAPEDECWDTSPNIFMYLCASVYFCFLITKQYYLTAQLVHPNVINFGERRQEQALLRHLRQFGLG